MSPRQRSSGVLLHITSLPSRFGIGDLGPEALRFAEFLALAGQSRWQMLPLSPTASSLGNSPYSSFSAFAANTLCISPELLVEDGLLNASELPGLEMSGLEMPLEANGGRVDFPAVERAREALLRRVFEGALPGLEDNPDFRAFEGHNATWLADYALFMAMKQDTGGQAWLDWPEDIRDRRPEALTRHGTRLHREILFFSFCQWLFFRQWGRLKKQLAELGVSLVGDVPIYVTLDSADVWANRRLFKLDETGRPTVVAGVPPDYFSATGQRWGNPVFDWQACQEQNFAWWISRLRHNFGLFEVVRLDHFRGFQAYWEIDAEEPTAVNGHWVPAPGEALFEAVRRAHGSLPIIAEDLGVITPDVVELKERFGLPGMKVLQFAFGPHTPDSPDSPHNHERNCVVYTGTHDNDTTRGWFEQRVDNGSDRGLRRLLERYLGRKVNPATIAREFVRVALASPADHAIIPAQDLLGLGSEARMNVPGLAKGNWGWRAPADTLVPGEGGRALAERLRGLCELYARADATPGE